MTPAEICARLHERFGADVVGALVEAGSPYCVVKTERIAEVAAFCKGDEALQLDNLLCLSAVDFHKEKEPRMEVVYHLFSYTRFHRFALKVHTPREGARVPTVESVWGVANWHEREAYDLFGIVFEGHSDLRRILLPDDWEGHPLRKDWVDPDFYRGMRVKPTEQMMERALKGEEFGTGPFKNDPFNAHVVGGAGADARSDGAPAEPGRANARGRDSRVADA